MYAQQPLSELLDAFSSSAPTPGGGSAAAMSGALGVSLLAMVAGLPKTKNNTVEERAALDEARTSLLAIRATLLDLIDRDAAAYDLVVAAFKHPKTTDAEKTVRKAAIQDAMRVAAEVPLETMRACAEALQVGSAVVEHGNPSAVSDVMVGTLTLTTAMQSALFNVGVNLESISDPATSERLAATAKEIMHMAGAPMRALYQSAAVRELMSTSVRRLGFGMHGAPSDSASVPAETFAGPVSELLKRIGTPEAREALEALARSARSGIASAARGALDTFEGRTGA